MGDTIDCRFNRTCDELLNLFRRQPDRFGLNDNLWRCKFRKHVELRTRCGVDAVAEHHDAQRDHDASKSK